MPLVRFTLRQIEAFVVVADQQSFSGAADRLGLTAQAVSQLIAELENVISFRVFDRTTRRVMLSAAGRDFLPAAQTMMRHVRGAETVADDLRNRAAGIVRIGAPLVLAATAVPEAIRLYQVQRPRVKVHVRDLAVDALVDAVAEGEVDLAVGPDRVSPPEVKRHELFDSPWVLWCTPDHPLARKRFVRWKDLREVPLVAAGRDHERSVEQMRLGAPDYARVAPVDVVDNITTALGQAAHGLRATLAPGYVGVLASGFGLTMKRVLEPETMRKVCLYVPVARALSPAGQGFADHLRSCLPSLAVSFSNKGRSRS